ncbi:eukaryotic translation initiation factor 4e related [Anaeramoeba flamelloides]|uniref:Eukaryotic translation initiation factor 4e related n=1 Tax=Anaeramoeba flamelloides TaxID=1746091 RepID=A0AAV8AGL3_9EUKA|nr:eukaryotic translation initiation factor 4e related [Anaeramoeba flamelloides]KAJ6252685.1 eukaryotic translation initiation factor 4e related [Anaeramoeba flamelloides]
MTNNESKSPKIEEKETEISEKNEKEQEKEKEKILINPLQNKWTMWVDGYSQSRNWGEDLVKISDFQSVGEFWGMYENLAKISKTKNGTNFHLFKTGIKPAWEDSENINGGKWFLRINRSVLKLDEMWLITILSMIGENYEYNDEICGAVVSIRNNGDRIALWTKTATNKEAQMAIGKKWKEELKLRGIRLSYLIHKDSLSTKKDRGSFKPTYEI